MPGDLQKDGRDPRVLLLLAVCLHLRKGYSELRGQETGDLDMHVGHSPPIRNPQLKHTQQPVLGFKREREFRWSGTPALIGRLADRPGSLSDHLFDRRSWSG